MLRPRPRSWRARLAIAYDSWLLAQTRRRWLQHDRTVLLIPGWAHAQVAQLVWELNTQRATVRWAGRETQVSLADWARAMGVAADRMDGTLRKVGPIDQGDGAPGG